MQFQTHTLKNGLRVVLAPMKGAESVTVMVMSGTGSRFESEKENGMAHFLEHMVFKGTKKRPTAKHIAEELDGVGGMFNAFTSKDYTAYYAKVDKRHFKTAFDVVSDIFLNATLPTKEITKERGTIIEEINMYEDMPIRNVLDEADLLLYGEDHALGRTILGPKENILSFKRADFLRYLQRNYVADNSVVCIAGNFSQKEALDRAKKTFTRMRTGAVPACEPYEHSQTKPRVRIKHKKTDQTHFVLSVPSYSFSEKNELVPELLASILGGGMSSRLFTEVREKRGLAYYVKAENDRYSDIGSLYMRAGVANTSLTKALETSLKEVRKLVTHRVPAKELKKAKEYVKGNMALALDGSDDLARFLGYSTVVRGKIENLKAYNKRIDAITAADIQEAAKELFKTEKLNLTVIGPHKNKKAFAALLKI